MVFKLQNGDVWSALNPAKLQITMGKKESYRAYMAELSLSDDESDSDIKYAVVMTNISQLEQTSEEHSQSPLS